MKTDTETMIAALRILSRDIQSDDGVANACIAEAADLIERLQTENAELCRFRAAVGHMEQELNVLRSREMNIDDIADYSEDRAKLTATIEQTKRIVRLCFDLKEKYRKEVTQLKLAKAELVEVLKKSLNIEYRTRLVCRMDFSRTQKDLEGREEALRVLLDEVKAAIAKHGGGK